MDSKYKRLFSDTALFTISNFGSKILTFLLVPLYTSVLSTNEYGTADIISTTVSLMYPILTLSICDATLRFALDKNSNKKSVLSNSLLLIIFGCCWLLLCTPFVLMTDGIIKEYWSFFVGTFITAALQSCLANYIKGCGKTKLYAIQGILYTIVLITCNIVFLLVVKIGLQGYLLSIIVANLFCSIFMVVFSGDICSFFMPSYDKGLLKEMLKYSIPMIPTSIAWWISASADKYMLIWIVGIGANGLYAVAHKIPTIFSTFTGLFSQAWRISAISNYNADDSKNFYTVIYSSYRVICIYACIGITMCSELIAHLLFKAEYYDAWVLVPPLILAALFEAYSGFLASIYAAAKKTNLLFISTCIGAVFNIILNIILIRILGMIGAPIATFISFIVVWGIRSIVLSRIIKIYVCYSKLIASLCLLIFGGLYFSYRMPYRYFVYIIISFFIICLNWHDTKALILKAREVVRKKEN